MIDNGRVLEIGTRLFSHMTDAGPTLMSKDWWENQLMELSMKHESFKVKMFRFVDAFPMLRGSTNIARHFHEYFPDTEGAPAIFKAPMKMAQLGLAPDLVIGKSADIVIKQMARGFIAGSSAKETIKVVESLRKKNIGFTLDVLGESTISEGEADRYCAIYHELIPTMAGLAAKWKPNPQVDGEHEFWTPPVNVSIKLTSMYSGMNPMAPEPCIEALKNRLRPLMKLAMKHKVAMHVDQESYHHKEIITRTFLSLLDEPEFAEYPYAGIVVQAYLRTAEQHVQYLIDWASSRKHPVYIRLVKGAYWDYETITAEQKHLVPPVWTRKWQSDACYERCAAMLLDNYMYTRPEFASHNIRSIASAITMAEARNVPRRAYEFQVLYGMGDPVTAAVTAEGYRCRMYLPFGDLVPGMGYLVRRLLENTSNDSFLLQTLDKNRDEKTLLQPPAGEPEDTWPKMKEDFNNTPEVDWCIPHERENMKTAIADVRSACGLTVPLVINGERITTEERKESLNPSHTSEVVGTVSQADTSHAGEALKAARATYPSWNSTPFTGRVELLLKAGKIMLDRKFELAAWTVVETAKTWGEAVSEVEEAIDYCNYYAGEMMRLGPAKPAGHAPGEASRYGYEGRGVGVVISPWNFPLSICAGMTLAAVVTGNTVVLKPSSFSPVTAWKFFEIMEQAGMPNGVINFLPGPGSRIGDSLIRSEETNFIVFTGSRDTGLHICKAAAETPGRMQGLKNVIAEMGGKNAIVIDDDANIDEALVGVITSAFGYAGQKCSACSRVIVLEPVYDIFCKRLAASVENICVGPAENPEVSVNAVIDESARQSILEYIETGKHEGRVLVSRDISQLSSEGYYVPPTVIADVEPQAVIAREEIFGPVLAVIKAKDMDEAIAVANDTHYALTGGIFSRSPKNIERCIREFTVGNLYINRTITGAIVERQPFGGFKMSGTGAKAGGPDYLLQFMNPRTITENTLRSGFAPKEKGIEN